MKERDLLFTPISEKIDINQVREHSKLSPETLAKKQDRDRELEAILKGEDDRLLLVIGPCSSDNEEAVLDYAHRLAKFQEEVKDKIFMIMRVYTAKPRTNGDGYKGLMHQPDTDAAPSLINGIKAVRNLHHRVITETGLTTADEMLYPENLPLVDDLVSYIAIGARSVENQQHRFVASGIDVPTGLKNPFIIIDTNHDNSGKNYLEQIRIVRQTLINRDWNEAIRNYVRGFMIESYIEDGRQDNPDVYGKSITDPCLGWEKTQELIREIYNR
ncbi:TPA: 3-deoxy-7-phosphoheptulonate synthase [Streptococcus suis]